MKTIAVKASRPYDVHVGPGLLAQTGSILLHALKNPPRTIAIISDSNVAPLYEKTLARSLKSAGFNVVTYSFLAGENQKNIDTYEHILYIISQNHLTRTDLLVALGGGVTGDLTGFAAATYLRGIPYLQLPTTLLAAVDSSVGGKTAINLENGKNLAGAFCQPSLVLCDTDCLKTLPNPVFCDGFAEVIKYAMIGGGDLLSLLKNIEDPSALRADTDTECQLLTEIIAACVAAKAALVEADEFDQGPRRLLNFGHSFGHAIEAASQYRLSHGQAVAVGMSIMTRAAVAKGLCPADVLEILLSLLAKFQLPSSINDAYAIINKQEECCENRIACQHLSLSWDVLAEIATSDKKNLGGFVHLVVPTALGCCTIVPVPQAELGDWLRAGGVA